MMNACDVEYAYSYVEDVDNLGLFNWPAPRFQKHPFCHRVKNAVLCDATDYSLRLPFIFGSNLLLIGDLWSSDRSCTALPVKAIVDSHLVEITQSVSKVTVALWVKDHVDVWYKLIIPRSLVYNDLDKEFAQLIHGFAADPSIEGLVECALLVDADGAEANIMDLLKATNGSGESVRFLQGIGILPGAKANVRINVTAAELVVREGVGNIVERTVRVSSGFGHWYRLLSPECAPAAVRTIYEHVYLAKTSLGDLFTVTDFRVVVSGQPVAPTTLGSSKGLLTGKLLGAGTAAAINICFAVDDYFVDMNNMSLDSPNFFVRTVDGCWCKLLRSADHPIDFPALLARYDWPADSKDEAWRHMTDFKVSSANSMCSMLDVVEDAAASLKPFMITCSLISPHNNTAKLKVRLYPNRYSVDFGLTEGDPNAGLWVCVDEGLQWYKVVPPALPEYATLAAMDLRRTSQVILLHDALVRVSDAICISLGKNGKKYCNFSLDEVWDMVHCLQAKKGKGTFSLDAIREDGQFAMNNLDLVIDFSKSKHLTKSLLTGEPTIFKNALVVAIAQIDVMLGALVKKMNIAAVQLPLVVPANSSAVAVSDLKDTFTSKAVPIGKKRKTTISYDDGEEKDEDNLPIAKLPKSLHSCPSAPPILTHIAPIANRSIGKRARIDDDCDMPPVLRRDQIHHAPQFTVLPMSAAVCGPKAETYSFCRYCQSLNKKHNCKSRDHVDGFPFRGHLLASTSVRLARPEQVISDFVCGYLFSVGRSKHCSWSRYRILVEGAVRFHVILLFCIRW